MKNMLILTISNSCLIIGLGLIGYFTNSEYFLSKMGIDYKFLLLFCFCWGFLISGLSLAFSKFIAKWFCRVRIINQKEPKLSYFEKKLLETVRRVSIKANIPMPDVGLYDSNEINAFATGPSKNNSLIAFTSNIFNVMDWEEIEGVIAHEISHIKNGDMVAMTLLQGLVNSFSMFLSRMISYSLIQGTLGEKAKFFVFTYFIYNWIIMFFEGIFLWLGSFVTNFYSRKREYRADKDGALLVGKRKIIKTLYCLMKYEDQDAYNDLLQEKYFPALKISHPKSMFFGLLSSHPPMNKRIKAVIALEIDESIDEMSTIIPMELKDVI